MNAAGLVDALDKRYGQRSDRDEQWVTIREARSGAGFAGNARQCDYLAVNSYPGRGVQIIGHELKVSKTDWKRELEEPEKAEAFAALCTRWWVVMPSELAKEVRPEVPPTWGLMGVSDKGRITELVKAPVRQQRQDVPYWWWVGWLAQLDRRDKRARKSEIDRLVNERAKDYEAAIEDRVNLRVKSRLQTIENLTERVNEFRAATGIDLRHSWPADFKRFGRLLELSRRGLDFDLVAVHLRQTAEVLDTLHAGGEEE